MAAFSPSAPASRLSSGGKSRASRRSSVASPGGPLADRGWLDFEAYGSFAGPPSQPQVTNVASTSLLLHWEAPSHLGGSGFEVLGYEVRVQYAGEGGFAVHVEHTNNELPQCAIEELSPDMWHEFCIAAITSAGVGARSASSRPVLTERAPRLLRELRSATKQLNAQRSKLHSKRSELIQLARSGTMALPLGGDKAAGGGTPDGRRRSTGAAEDDDEVDLAAAFAASGVSSGSPARMSAAETRQSVRARKSLERSVNALERRVEEAELHLSGLQEQQGLVDEQRRDELDEAANHMHESMSEPGSQPRIYMATPLDSAAVGVSDTPYSTHTGRSVYSQQPPSPGAPFATPGSAASSFGAAATSVQAASRLKRLPGGRRRSISEERKHMARLAAYTRLFMEEDLRAAVTYPPFDREGVRKQIRRALAPHVLADEASEKKRYFDLCLNRVRSAVSHNAFPRFADWELEQLVLLFGRFDTDHDGVLEYADFCRLMLLVGERVHATYHQGDMLRMFKKVDVNDDKLIDLNEFLLMQLAPTAAAEDADGPPQGVHPPPERARDQDGDEDVAWSTGSREAEEEDAYSDPSYLS